MLTLDYSPNRSQLEHDIKSLNNHILEYSGRQFDLGSFVDSNLNISTTNIRGITDDFIIPHAKSFIDGPLRTQIIGLLKQHENVPQATIIDTLKQVLKRNVLYVGSECERQGFIGVDAEYDDLNNVLVSEYMELNRVKKPTIGELMRAWEEHKPSIVFISCHGLADNLFLQDEAGNCKEYNNTEFVGFFKKRTLFTECVVLSACESLSLGKLIIESCRNVVCINKAVDINTARLFCNVFMEHVNDRSLDDDKVYEEAFGRANEYVRFEGLEDSFAFKFLKSDVISR